MDREGFRNRLKQYKEARGQNPQLKYWEWKAQPAEEETPKYEEGTGNVEEWDPRITAEGYDDKGYYAQAMNPMPEIIVHYPYSKSSEIQRGYTEVKGYPEATHHWTRVTGGNGALQIVSPEFDLATAIVSFPKLAFNPFDFKGIVNVGNKWAKRGSESFVQSVDDYYFKIPQKGFKGLNNDFAKEVRKKLRFNELPENTRVPYTYEGYIVDSKGHYFPVVKQKTVRQHADESINNQLFTDIQNEFKKAGYSSNTKYTGAQNKWYNVQDYSPNQNIGELNGKGVLFDAILGESYVPQFIKTFKENYKFIKDRPFITGLNTVSENIEDFADGGEVTDPQDEVKQKQAAYREKMRNYVLNWYNERLKHPEYATQIGVSTENGPVLNPNIVSTLSKDTYVEPENVIKTFGGRPVNIHGASVQGGALPEKQIWFGKGTPVWWHEGIGHMVGDTTPGILQATPDINIQTNGPKDEQYDQYINQTNEKHSSIWEFRGANVTRRDKNGNLYIDPNRKLTGEDVQEMIDSGAYIPTQWKNSSITPEQIADFHNTFASVDTDKSKRSGIFMAADGGEVPQVEVLPKEQWPSPEEMYEQVRLPFNDLPLENVFSPLDIALGTAYKAWPMVNNVFKNYGPTLGALMVGSDGTNMNKPQQQMLTKKLDPDVKEFYNDIVLPLNPNDKKYKQYFINQFGDIDIQIDPASNMPVNFAADFNPITNDIRLNSNYIQTPMQQQLEAHEYGHLVDKYLPHKASTQQELNQSLLVSKKPISKDSDTYRERQSTKREAEFKTFKKLKDAGKLQLKTARAKTKKYQEYLMNATDEEILELLGADTAYKKDYLAGNLDIDTLRKQMIYAPTIAAGIIIPTHLLDSDKKENA